LEVASGRQRETVEGWVPELATEDELRQALKKHSITAATSR